MVAKIIQTAGKIGTNKYIAYLSFSGYQSFSEFFLQVVPVFFCFFFYLAFFFHKHLRFKGEPGKGETISLNPLYHFRLLYRHSVISRVITKQTHLCT